MESIAHKIRKLYPEMGRAEKKIADYILENSRNITECSVTELAKICGCGDATVVRFSRRLGYDGFQALKIGIAGELGSASTISGEIKKDDSCYEIFKKRINDISVSLQSTESVLDEAALENAAKLIMNARRIAVFGLGNSAAIAMDAAHKFLRLGLDAQSCTDNHMQAIIASHLDRQSVAIGISHSGSSKDIVEALKLSKIGNAATICVTNFAAYAIQSAKTPIRKIRCVLPLKKHIPAKTAAVSTETDPHSLCNLLINFPSFFSVKQKKRNRCVFLLTHTVPLTIRVIPDIILF